MKQEQLESTLDYPTGKKYIELLKAIGEISLECKKWKAVAVAFEKERDAYENALIKIDKLASDDCPDFALDSIQSLTNKILND